MLVVGKRNVMVREGGPPKTSVPPQSVDGPPSRTMTIVVGEREE
jgi:hypothetical protein